MEREFTCYPLLMEPYFSRRPWGGSALRGILHKEVPQDGEKYGEAWELSDHPDGRSRVANGVYAGRLFGDLLKEFPQGMLGLEHAPARYPLLIKYIDAAEDLSVQVHPSDATAPTGDRGKTECWYIMHTQQDKGPGAAVVWGLRPGVDAALLHAACDAGSHAVEQCIQRVPIATGDFVYIPAGTVHAILAGTLLCEIQQSSNTTYRLWDWERKPARELHLDDGCAVTNFDAASQKPLVTKTESLAAGAWHELAGNAYFTVRLGWWPPGARKSLEFSNRHGLIVCVPDGAGALSAAGERYELVRGQTWFLPAGVEKVEIETQAQPLRLLLSQARELE